MNLRLSSLRAMFIHQGKGRLSATATAAAIAAVTFALAGVGMSNALAAPGAAASAPDAASVSYANGGQFTVKPGQSLNDVAIAVTQSHDRATLARASRALFDANPNAFMSHDPSRMRLGAVLTVPVLDASGGLAASAAVATATASGASTSTSAPAAAAASTPVGTMAATTATGAAAATGAASAVAQVNAAAAAAASAASAATRAAAPATPAAPGIASAVTEAGSATPGSGATTAGGAVASASGAGSQTAVPASGTHEWSGSIQPSASESAAGASASAAGSAAMAAQAASQPRAQVSSLQQLLALKNRVLMELQKHGIGGTPAVTRAASTGAAVSAGASSAAAVSGHGGAAIAVSNDGGISQVGLSIAAAVGAALVVLLAALRMRRRKRNANAAAEVSAADGDTVASAQANESRDVASAREQGSARDTSDDSVDVSLSHAAALAAAEHEAAEGAAAAREQAEREAAERDAEIRQAAARDAERKAAESAAVERAESERVAKEQAEAERAAAELAAQRAAAEQHAAEQHAAEQHAAEQHAAAERGAAEREAAEHAAAKREATEHAAAEREAAEHAAAEREAAEHAAAERAASEQAAAERAAAERDSLNSATTAASLAAAAELGAEALPLTPLDPVDESFQHEPPAHRLQWDDEPAPSAPAAEIQNPPNVPPPAIDFTQQPVEPRDTPTPFGQPYADASAHPLPDTTLAAVPLTHPEPAHDEATYQPSYELHQPTQAATLDGASSFSEPTPLSQAQHTLTAPTEFPRDAVDAFSALDMPLPPRIESPFESLGTPASLTTQPVASPETTAQQALAPHDPDDVPHIADEITAGTAGHAAVAGLGATGFGAAGGLSAAGFGALKLDFDLELPPSPAQPLPAFTPADLTRIARNKLDLAAEYIDLGDLSGARSLINEVIEANDPATRTEARALLSTLAPLS
ncbi:fimbrial protein FimV [Paraburkholderia bryophila]|uniref:FimV/HubP family polar landmark protein n=1 Tax=Paraburkholderia bryophila TaxID=420952 RepID=UPI00234A535F|nr:FimV/HubP family polar landmark protein [Paraburkholderia bryophila]WCM23253.1 fimbrial protein FimV [Paraburkholderia bryophila]